MTTITINDGPQRDLLCRLVWNHAVAMITDDTSHFDDDLGLGVEFWDTKADFELRRNDLTARVEAWQQLNERVDMLRQAPIGEPIKAPLSDTLLIELLQGFRRTVAENMDLVIQATKPERNYMLWMYDGAQELLEELQSEPAAAVA